MAGNDEGRINRTQDIGFAPKDYTDGRKEGDWQSRYDAGAWKFIWQEARYLALALFLLGMSILFVWLQYPQRFFELSERSSAVFTRYSLALLSGSLGGVLFSMKWLYHSGDCPDFR